jgi:MSHA pilin protein MshA
MHKKGGFTLIELVVVVVILGILAVTAAPRFINLQSDANTAVLNGLRGALQSAVSTVYAKATLLGKETSAISTDVPLNNGVQVKTMFGYPIAVHDELVKIIDADFEHDWQQVDYQHISGGDAHTVYYTLRSVAFPSDKLDQCYISYRAATISQAPIYTVKECK